MPLPVCEHSQGGPLLSQQEAECNFPGFIPTNKQIKKTEELWEGNGKGMHEGSGQSYGNGSANLTVAWVLKSLKTQPRRP